VGARFVTDPGTTCVSGLVVPAELETVTQAWFEDSGCGIDRNLFRYRYRALAAVSSSSGKPSGVGRRRFLVCREGDDVGLTHSLYMLGPFGMGCNFAFRREFLKEMGGFDVALGAGTPARGGEDIVLLVEVLFSGGTLAFEPSAIISHTHRRTSDELRDQVHGYGVGLTAAFTALVWRDPRHLLGLLGVAMPAARSVLALGRPSQTASPTTAANPNRTGIGYPAYPRQLRRLQRLGMLTGPVAYGRSRWRFRIRVRKGP
jgi:hypothetical protein